VDIVSSTISMISLRVEFTGRYIMAPHEDQDDLHYFDHSDEKLKEEYCVLYMELMKLRKCNQKKLMKLDTMKTGRDTLLQKITDLEDKLMDAQLQLEKFLDNKLAQMLTS
jgi:hypothetical protein